MQLEPIRKRMKRRETPGDIRFVTFSCEKRLPLLGRAAIREVFNERLAEARNRFPFELFCWVVMPEHVHLLVRPTIGLSLARPLEFIKKSTSRRILIRWRQIEAPILNHIRRPDGSYRFWQKGGGFDRNVRSLDEFCREAQYIHQNPVTRGLAQNSIEWKWSSARWWAGDRSGQISCDLLPPLTEQQMRQTR